jgi:hypothetical protein
MHLTYKSADKLRAGNSVWRCMVFVDTLNQVYVDITHMTLQGRKGRTKIYPWIKVGKDYAQDVRGHGGRCQSFTTFRGAQQFKKEITAGIDKYRAIPAAHAFNNRYPAYEEEEHT